MRRIENALTEIADIDPIWKKFQVGIRDGIYSKAMIVWKHNYSWLLLKKS